MLFHVEPSQALPMYAQLADQIRAAVASGRLAPGDKLPGVRELAEQLGINLQTAAKAYAELTAAGLLRTRHGSGTFVAQRSSRTTAKHARDVLRDKLVELRRLAGAMGLERDEVDALLDEIWETKAWKR